ncbi:related to microfibril-associated protein [Melanopsichium pennsylvanicum]|uniref:Related to microfibril-associated protein n=1 Tax=Melanopsichium pennsylvanicum TaxID=63383 RepID=A0AAJ5C7K5_9BASI|nr:related to microfibril-associated protein [Melanopsichium pennsylvanicum]
MAPSQPPKSASRLARPAARYRPGKAPLGASLDDYSDSDESDSGHNHNAKPDEGVSGVKDLSSGTKALLHSGAARKGAAIVISDASAGGKRLDLRLNAPIQAVKGKEEDSSEYETDTGSEEEDIAKPVFRKPGTAGPPPPPAAAKPQHHVTADSGSSEYETDSSSEESSEEDAPQPLLKPVFKPKAARTTISAAITDTQIIEPDPETKAELEAAARRKEAHDLAEATIQRSLAERKHSELSSVEVDDTDGLDAEAEFAAWRERELARLKRDHDAIQQKLQEQRELECFKSLPESEKERLGRERAAQQRAEKKEQRGQPGFMQKYYHKGSFFQDMDIWNRDFTEKTEKDVDVRALPKIMQVRGGQIGVKGRSKWTHLANEDTSKAQFKLDVPTTGQKERGCFTCGGPHLKKDCPVMSGGDPSGSGSGANRAQVEEGNRRWGKRAEDEKKPRSKRDSKQDRSPSPRRDSSRYGRYDDIEGSRASRDRYGDHDSSRGDKNLRSRYDREHRKHHQSSSNSHQDGREHARRHRSHREDEHRRNRHRSHRDDSEHDRDQHGSRSDRHDSDDHKRRHRDDDTRHRHRHGDDARDQDKRRDREHRHQSSASRGEESDRKHLSIRA